MSLSMYSALVPAAFRMSEWSAGSPFSAAGHDTVAWIAGDSIVRGVFFVGATVALCSLLEDSKKRDFKTVKASELPTFIEILGSKGHQSQLSLKSWCLFVTAGVCVVAAAILTTIGVCAGGASLLGSVFVITKDSMLAGGFSQTNAGIMGLACVYLSFMVGAGVFMYLIRPREQRVQV